MEKVKNNKVTVIISCLLLFVPLILGAVFYNKMPEQLPTHFGPSGEPDSYASKFLALIGFPLIFFVAQVLVVFVTAADPKHKNINDSVYSIMLFLCPAISLFYTYTVINYGLGNEINIRKYITLLLSVIFIVIGNYLPKSRRNYSLGIRVPWALNSDDNWNATHRIGGIVFIIIGVLGIFISLFINEGMMYYFIGAFMLALIPTIYSYIYYLKYEKDK